MKVLVAGDRGYIGAVLVPFLQAHGHEVVGLDAGWYEGCDFGPVPLGYEQRTGDVRDAQPDDLARHSTRWCTWRRSPTTRSGTSTPAATYSVNADGAVHLGRAAKAAGVERYVFASSCSLYGAAGDAPVDEDAPFNPVTPYGESKVRGRGRAGSTGRRRLQPHLPAQRHGLRFVAPAAGRHRREQPDRYGLHARRGAAAERRRRRGGRSSTRRTSPAPSLCALEAPRDVVHDQAFNVGRDEDVVQIRDHRRAGGGGARRPGHLRRGRRPRHARLPGRLPRRSASCSRRSSRSWTVPAASSSWPATCTTSGCRPTTSRARATSRAGARSAS